MSKLLFTTVRLPKWGTFTKASWQRTGSRTAGLLLTALLGFQVETQAQTCPTTVAVFPHVQDFESGVTGSPGTLPAGWTTSSTPASSTYRWELDAGGTPSSLTGPNIDHTLGTAAGKYVFTEASSGVGNDVTELISPCFNLTGLTNPGIEFWYHMAGAGMGPMNIDVSTNNGTTWTNLHTFTGPQQLAQNDPWLKKQISLTAYIGQTVKIRFKGTKNASPPTGGFDFEGDMAVDDFKVFNLPTIDAELVAITSPASASGCAFTATENICISIKNNGVAAITTMPVRYQIGTNPVVNETFTGNIAPGATANYCFVTKANLATAGTYTLTATTMLGADGDPSNDSKTRTITVVPNISTFPYFQNFESGNGGWVASGTNSSWALGTPAKTIINSAGSGTNSWVTGLTGTYNSSEISQVAGPCFNLSSLVQPIVQMKIWWSSEGGWDGAVLQSSINGGTTWQNVGALNDPNNWYNDNSLDGRAGGQNIGWAGTGAASSGGWVTAKHNLTGLGGQSSVLLRIAFGSDPSVQEDGFAFDDFSIFESPTNDVGIVAVTSPITSGCGFTATENVCITLTNLGTVPTSTIPLSYQIGSSPAVNEVANLVIAPGATATYCFTTKANLSVVGTYNFTITSNLPNDGNPSNNSATRTVTVVPTISTFPYVQNFDAGAGGWIASGTNSSWALGTPAKTVINSAASGPNSWVTNLTGTYNSSEISQVLAPCFNFSSLVQPIVQMKIWWSSEGGWDGAVLQSSINGGATWQNVGALNDPNNWYNDASLDGRAGGQDIGWAGSGAASSGGWVIAKNNLTGLGGQTSVQLRIAFGADGAVQMDGFAFDDFSIFESPANDVGIVAITSPIASGCGFTATENVCITITNLGTTPTTTIPVSYQIGTNAAVNEVANLVIAPGGTGTYCFTTKANLSVVGTYNFTITTNLPNDGNPINNSATRVVTVVPTISTLPYTEGFENGNGGWVASGTNSSWAIGTPAKSVINSAGSGTNSYVTGLTGTYNASEISQVLSPCFNFTGMPDPDFEMKIWWSSETGWDGAVLQSSINGGTTWQNVGALNDPNNWYNDGSLDGRAGGQDIGWAGSPGSGGWVRAKHKLNGLGGQSSVRLRIAFGADGAVQMDGFAFDDIRIGDNTNNLAINSFVPLTQLCGFGTNEKVEVVLENLGSVAVTGYTVSYTVNGGNPVTAQGPNLAPGVPTNFVFPTGANLSAAGTYTIVVTVNKPGDPEAANNSVTYTISNATFTSLPPVFNFETPTTGIAALRAVTNAKSAITEGAAASLPLNGQPTTSTKGMIMEATSTTGWVVPVGITDPWTNNAEFFSAVYICFNPAGGNPNDPLWLSFDLKQLFKTANANTNFRVTVNGTPVGGNQVSPANTYRPPFNGTGGTTNWTKINIDLTAYKGGNIQIGLESSVAEPFAAGAGTANLVDNIRILRSNPTGVKDNVLARSLSVYPNPSAGLFTVSLPSGKTFEMEVTDLTGKTIMKQTVKGNATQLDLKTQAQGVYMLKITSEGASAIQKLIIQ